MGDGAMFREIFGWVGGIFFIILVAGFFAYGVRDQQIKTSCDQLGKVVLDGHVYICSAKGKDGGR